jgi:uncharacterized membrane protein
MRTQTAIEIYFQIKQQVMKSTFGFLNKTIKGGLFFIIPISLILLLCGKVLGFLRPVANRISAIVDKDGTGTFDLSYFITIVLLLLLCFICGVAATSGVGKAFIKWIEDNVLVILPGYQLMKNAGQVISGLDASKNFPVVLVLVDGWMIAFLMNTLPDDEVVVFVPGSPSPWSGNVMIFKKSEIRETSLTQKEAIAFLRQTGVGLNDLKIK